MNCHQLRSSLGIPYRIPSQLTPDPLHQRCSSAEVEAEEKPCSKMLRGTITKQHTPSQTSNRAHRMSYKIPQLDYDKPMLLLSQ